MGRLQRQHHVGKAPQTAEITAGNAPSAQCPPPQDHHRADHGRRGARRGHSRRVLRSQGVARHQGPQRRRHLLRAGLQRSGIRVRGVHRLAGREPVQHRQASRRGRSGQVRGRVHRCLIGYDAVSGHLSAAQAHARVVRGGDPVRSEQGGGLPRRQRGGAGVRRHQEGRGATRCTCPPAASGSGC